MKILYAPLVILCLGLGACMSQVPMATTYPVTYQKKMQAAQHWDILAADVASRLLDTLAGSDTQPGCSLQPRCPISFHVQQPRYDSDFGEAFHNLLITHLLERGFLISENPAEGMSLTYNIQVVTHNDRGFIRPVPGLFTVLTSSVLVLHSVGDSNPATAAMLGAVGLDVATGFITDNPNSEIIVTTTVMKGDHYVTRLRDIYYVSDNNVGQYIAKGPKPVSTRMVEVVGP